MILELLSVAILGGKYANEKISNYQYDKRNREYDIASGNAARFGKDAWLFREKTTTPQIINEMVASGVKVPFNETEREYIRNRVKNLEVPYYRQKTLDKYNNERKPGEEYLRYPFKTPY